MPPRFSERSRRRRDVMIMVVAVFVPCGDGGDQQAVQLDRIQNYN